MQNPFFFHTRIFLYINKFIHYLAISKDEPFYEWIYNSVLYFLFLQPALDTIFAVNFIGFCARGSLVNNNYVDGRMCYKYFWYVGR